VFFSLNGKNATQKEKQKPIKNKKKAKKHKVNKTVGELKYTQVQ